MECSALCSPCAGSLRGATHPRTLTNYTPQTPCTQQLCPSALKEAFPCSARCWRPHAAAHRDPSMLFAAVAFDLLLCAAVLQPSQTSVGLEGWIWLYGVSDADKPSSRYSTSSVIFIPHVFNFSLFLPTPKILNRLWTHNHAFLKQLTFNDAHALKCVRNVLFIFFSSFMAMGTQKIYFFALSVWTSYIDALTVKKNVMNTKNITNCHP